MAPPPRSFRSTRERRAWERAEKQKRKAERDEMVRQGLLPPRSDTKSERSSVDTSPAYSPPRGPPKPGESLFDNYANLQGPTKFSTDEEEVEELLRMGVGWGKGSFEEERYLEANWDPSPHKNPPAYLKAIKPITREPWTIDQQVYNATFDTSDFGKPTRYGIDMDPPLSAYRLDDPRMRPRGAKKGWDSSTFRQVPYSLRGIKPSATSTEPWVKDQANRAGDFEDTDVLENETAVQLDNGGEARFKKGAFNAYKNERNRKLHADPWDSSTRTW